MELKRKDDDKPWFQRQWAKATSKLYGRVLDFGSGTELECAFLADLPAVESVCAYDISMDIEKTKNRLSNYGFADRIDLLRDPAALDALSGTFDCAFSWNVTEHLACPLAEFDRVFRCLKKGGLWSFRHHPYYSFIDGHHLLGQYLFRRVNPRWSGCLTEGPHLFDPDSFVRDNREVLRLAGLNMMTLFQLRCFLVMAGFEIDLWDLTSKEKGAVPVARGVSEQDALSVCLHVVARKGEEACH